MLERLNEMLELYNEREKILRLICYSSELIAGLTKNRKLATFSSLLSECRTTMRLFDDIPMLKYSISYGLGKSEPDLMTRLCSVVVNLCDQLYYPLEHVAWAADKQLINVRSNPWWTLSNLCWSLSLYFSIIRSLRRLHLLQEHANHLKLSDAGMRQEFKRTSRRQLGELLTGIRCTLDLVLAIHWMPAEVTGPWPRLWAGQLRRWHIGAVGTASSAISLAQTWLAEEGA